MTTLKSLSIPRLIFNNRFSVFGLMKFSGPKRYPYLTAHSLFCSRFMRHVTVMISSIDFSCRNGWGVYHTVRDVVFETASQDTQAQTGVLLLFGIMASKVMRSVLLGAVLWGSHLVHHVGAYYLPGALPQSFNDGDQ